MIQAINKTPTFDLTNLSVIAKERLKIFLETDNIMFFDNVYAQICLRSRSCRPNTPQSEIIDNHYSAVIDAGFVGKLVFSVKLLESAKKYSDQEILEILSSGFSLMLFKSPANNYYNGTNQTNLEANIIFQSND